MGYKVKVLFGEDAVRIYEEEGMAALRKAIEEEYLSYNLIVREFKFKEAAKAYIQGMYDMLGWGEYIILDNHTRTADIECECLVEKMRY